jgi:hypothetical protein
MRPLSTNYITSRFPTRVLTVFSVIGNGNVNIIADLKAAMTHICCILPSNTMLQSKYQRNSKEEYRFST